MSLSICVFCGSALGKSDIHAKTAEEFGSRIARRGATLVYGGGNIGTMGILAEAAMKAGGRVVGIIPERLHGMVEHLEISELIVVRDMHERKARMQELSDAFVALPGGIGTMEELFEVWTWRYIGYHAKPAGLLNTGGFYDDLLRMLETMTREGFLKPEMLEDLCVEKSPEAMLETIEARLASPVEPVKKLPERRC